MTDSSFGLTLLTLFERKCFNIAGACSRRELSIKPASVFEGNFGYLVHDLGW